jgi:uncharacterized protein (DUF885 family)/Fe-S-cluster containining protein
MAPEELNRKRKAVEQDAARFYNRLKRRPPPDLEATIKEMDAEVFAKTDCLSCANCCKTLKTVFKERDIDRIAAHLQLKPGQLVHQYLMIDEDGDYVQQQLPCPFLADDNKCKIYEVRPAACRSYPHTGTLPIKKSWNLVIKNAAVCPAVYEITEQLKQKYTGGHVVFSAGTFDKNSSTMTLKKISEPLLFIVLVACLPGMLSYKESQGAVNEDKRLAAFTDYFINQYWKLRPVDAIYAGYHVNDSIPFVPDKRFFDMSRVTLSKLSDTLKTFKTDHLSASFRIDYFIMRDRIESDLFYLNEFREYEWNPAYYNLGGEYAEILNNRNEPLQVKLRNISARLKKASDYYKAAKTTISKPTREHTELAILQNEGSLGLFSTTLPDSVRNSSLTEKEKEVLNARLQSAHQAVSDYISWLKTLKDSLNADNSRSYRIGRDLYVRKFEADIRSRYSADEVYEMAKQRKESLQLEMARIAKSLWPVYFGPAPMPDDDRHVIAEVIGKISLQHTTPDSFMIAIEQQIPELLSFITKKDLLWIDPAKPLVVRQTPAYMEGSGAGVTISSPGPYDKDGNTYYNVSPLTGYTAEQAESYLREYNRYMLQILNIHEAVPGHYTQLVYANRSPSMIKSLFGNGAMVEGWAVYTERMMLEEGYGDQAPEMWLMYYKWHLRSVCNTILDYEVHVNGWNEKVAIHFLTKEAFQQQAEAESKWRRVKLSQVQLCSYFTGYTEIYNLREELKKERGTGFSLKQFHEQFLGFGSAPVKYIRELMIQTQ